MSGNNNENNTGNSKGNNTVSNTDFKQKIRDLRVVVEKSVETLKKLEATGSENDANDSLWVVTGIWNGKEYLAIEDALKEKGYKSSIQASMEKLDI